MAMTCKEAKRELREYFDILVSDDKIIAMEVPVHKICTCEECVAKRWLDEIAQPEEDRSPFKHTKVKVL